MTPNSLPYIELTFEVRKWLLKQVNVGEEFSRYTICIEGLHARLYLQTLVWPDPASSKIDLITAYRVVRSNTDTLNKRNSRKSVSLPFAIRRDDFRSNQRMQMS
jgi:hypothetical protein